MTSLHSALDAPLRFPNMAEPTDTTSGHPPSGMPVSRRNLCGLARPCLRHPQDTQRFRFFDATLLWVVSGRLTLDDGAIQLTADAPSALILVDQHACADLLKEPGGDDQRFRSIFLTFAADLLAEFHRHHPTAQTTANRSTPFQQVALDDDLESTLQHCVQSIEARQVSDQRLRYRLMDLLAALLERGHLFVYDALQSSTSERLRGLISEAPERHWTAQEASRELAMSEATLRRRLAGEQVRFEELLVDVRMHHAMMLMQTTPWSIPHIAQACGYKSRTRFTERFKARFGCLPSSVR
jgi:AraC-like DNA-binding protein